MIIREKKRRKLETVTTKDVKAKTDETTILDTSIMLSWGESETASESEDPSRRTL